MQEVGGVRGVTGLTFREGLRWAGLPGKAKGGGGGQGGWGGGGEGRRVLGEKSGQRIHDYNDCRV